MTYPGNEYVIYDYDLFDRYIQEAYNSANNIVRAERFSVYFVKALFYSCFAGCWHVLRAFLFGYSRVLQIEPKIRVLGVRIGRLS